MISLSIPIGFNILGFHCNIPENFQVSYENFQKFIISRLLQTLSKFHWKAFKNLHNFANLQYPDRNSQDALETVKVY